MNSINHSTPSPSPAARRSADWPTFQVRLAEALDLLAEDQFLIVQQKQGSRCIQFAGQGCFGLRVETVSNHFLQGDEQISAEEHCALFRLGWQIPSGDADASTPELDPDGSPNYFIDFPAGSSSARIADLAVSTLADVLTIPHPSSLEYEAFDAEGSPILLPVLGLKRATAGKSEVSLPDMVLRAVRLATGIDDLEYDEDGDLCLRYGEISLFVALLEETETVRFCSPLASKVETSAGLLSRLNALNAEMADMHCVSVEGGVLAVSSIQLAGVKDGGFKRSLDRFAERAETIAIELRATFGGDALLIEPDSCRVLH